VKDQETNLGVHCPASGVALILDLVESLQVPGAILLTNPKRIVGTGIGGLDPPWSICTTLGGDSTVLHLDFTLGTTTNVRRSGDCIGPSDWRCYCRSCSADKIGGPRHRIGNSRSGDCGDATVEGLAVRIVGCVSGELPRRVVVSIHTGIRAKITAITIMIREEHALPPIAVAIGIIASAVRVVILTIGVVTLGMYRGLVTHSISAVGHSHSVTHAISHAVAHGTHNRRVWCSIWELLGVDVLSTVADTGLRHISVVVTRFGVSFGQAHHCVDYGERMAVYAS
jgi:hypothetical protein